MFGIARTTGTSRPAADSIDAVETPAAIETMRCTPDGDRCRDRRTDVGRFGRHDQALARRRRDGDADTGEARHEVVTAGGVDLDHGDLVGGERAGGEQAAEQRLTHAATAEELERVHGRQRNGGGGSGRFPDGRTREGPTYGATRAMSAGRAPRWSGERAQPVKREANPSRMAGRKHCSTYM